MDVTIPRRKLAEVLKEIGRLSKKYNLPLICSNILSVFSPEYPILLAYLKLKFRKYLFYRFEENQFRIFWNNGAEDFCFTKSSGLDLYFSRA